MTRESPLQTKNAVDQLAYKVIGAAIHVHSELGPGLLESVYHKCLDYELKKRGLKVESKTKVPLYYDSVILDEYLRLDLLINDALIVEVKAVEILHPVYTAQLITYLKLANKPKGLLINFNCERIMNDLISLVSEHYAKLPQD